MERTNTRFWLEEANATINNLYDDVTPSVLNACIRRRITEIPKYIFDRGKEIESSLFVEKPQIQLCIYEDHDEGSKSNTIPIETDRWERLHGL